MSYTMREKYLLPGYLGVEHLQDSSWNPYDTDVRPVAQERMRTSVHFVFIDGGSDRSPLTFTLRSNHLAPLRIGNIRKELKVGLKPTLDRCTDTVLGLA